MNLKNFKITNRGLYWGLIGTFLLLYVFVAFVSTLHAIDFFKLANVGGLAVLLGVAYEVGQASVLFSILMTKNKEKFLPWALMFLLTGLQITANVYASFKHMMTSGSTDWIYWQKSILFGVQATSPEMYQVIISWISGALLPVIALGMTALVAQQIKMIGDENELVQEKLPETKVEEIIENEVSRRLEVAKAAIVPIVEEPVPVVEEPVQVIPEEPVIPPVEKLKEISIEELLPSREDQLTGLKNAIVNNIKQKASPMEENPLRGEGGVQIVRPPVIINIGPETQEEANQEYAKSLEPEMKIGEGGIQVLKDAHSYDSPSNQIIQRDDLADDLKEIYDELDEEVDRLSPQMPTSVEQALREGKIELLPEDGISAIQTGEKKAIDSISEGLNKDIIESLRLQSKQSLKFDPENPEKWREEVKPINKVQGWHFKKEFIDDAGNIFEKGKYVGTDPTRIPKKA